MKVAEEFGLEVVDTRPLFMERWFRGEQSSTNLIFDYCHLTPPGHEIVADALAGRLVADLAPSPWPSPAEGGGN